MSTEYSRRAVISSLTCLVGGGCSNPVYSGAFQLAKTVTGFGDEVLISLDQVNQVSFATIGVRFNRLPQFLMVLGRYEGQDLHYFSNDRGVFVLRNGRVMRTVGLPENLRATNFLDPDPLENLAAASSGATFTRTVDLMKAHFAGLPFRSVFTRVGERKIGLLGRQQDTVYWTEQVECRTLDWRFTNEYWVDPTGYPIWLSKQELYPGFAPAEVSVLRPAVRQA